MRKFIVFVAVIIILSGAWFILKSEVKAVDPATLLPDETLLMLDFVDLEKNINIFKSSRLGQKLKEIDVTGVMNKLAAPPEVIKKYNDIQTLVLATIDSMAFKELFGKKAAIALLPVKITGPEPEELKNALGGIVLISRPKHGADLAELAGRIFTKNIKSNVETSAGYDIKSFELQDRLTLYYSTSGGLLLMTLDKETLTRCLDLKDKERLSLSKNKRYQYLYKKLAASQYNLFVYNNSAGMSDTLAEIVQNFISENKQPSNMKNALTQLKGIKSIGYAAYDNGANLLQNKLLMTINKDELFPVQAKAFQFKPEKNNTLGMIPDNILVYFWANTLNPESYPDIFYENLKIDAVKKESVKAWFEKNTGMGINEVCAAFGNQFGLILSDINSSGLFPIPELAVFVQAAKKDTMINLFESVRQKFQQGMLKKELFRGIPINYITLPFGSNLQPAYAFLNDLCILSTSRQLLKKMISTSIDGKGIIYNKDFLSVKKGLTDKNNSIKYIKFDNLLDKLKELADWGTNMLVLKNQDMANKGDIILNEIITPAIDGLKMYKSISSRIIFKDDEIQVDTYIKIDR